MEKRGKLELTWVGKYQDEKLEPRILIEDITKSYGDSDTENMLIHGDNLLALKALGQPSEPATKADIQVGKDLQDTLRANRERCVGMAANMIGVKKNIIIVNMGFIDVVMFNPAIVSKHDMYETEEGCLSLDGVRKTTRYQEIEVEYYDFNWKKQRQKLSGWTAQICQHEIDHLSGKII